MIKLGQRVRDEITGFEGIATARAEYRNGCISYCVQPTELEKGQMIEGQYIDVGQLIIISDEHVERPPGHTGGPMSNTPPAKSNG